MRRQDPYELNSVSVSVTDSFFGWQRDAKLDAADDFQHLSVESSEFVDFC